MTFTEAVNVIGRILDAIGIGVIVFGTVAALSVYLYEFIKNIDKKDSYIRARQKIGRAILLGLEFLVAGDIIRTVATAPSFRNAGVLALIVLIRTFLSFTLQVEVEHRWPWQKASP